MGQFLESWKDITPQLLSILLTTIIICTLCIVYNVKIRNLKDGEELCGFLVLTETFVGMMENMVVTTMGKKFKHLTPYAMYIFLYILVSSIIALLGFEPLSSSYTVTLSMAIVSFFGIYYYGLKYQKLLFFMKFAYNPIELLTQFVPILSLSFRLFGNILAGATILGLLYGALINAQGAIFGFKSVSSQIWSEDFLAQYRYWWSGFNFLSVIMLPWLHLYFDLFDGVIQSIVFTMLTLSYWANAKDGEHEPASEPVERDNVKKIKMKKVKVDLKTKPIVSAEVAQ
ncbi:F0F1 ATP synthase subunit A [Spiroplasma gladiatoris]|uniref:F0F1 ATP synthase subunit A n=1 Tax=Spiroplasma gladiatoris TaxID=2143 RepID=A0A4P7AHW8_9MOLU|nr:F0F1 ATP synthase subunit A [Spiroplasma gladiatoris]QBQ07263.1 F0F1 ATP synthase subunit A [Spiroplasma gladiatoris]